jgi:hypothetical protein
MVSMIIHCILLASKFIAFCCFWNKNIIWEKEKVCGVANFPILQWWNDNDICSWFEIHALFFVKEPPIAYNFLISFSVAVDI